MVKSGKLESNSKVRHALQELLVAADAAACKTDEQMTENLTSGRGAKIIRDRMWSYTTDFLEKKRRLFRECLAALAASEASEADLDSAMWAAVVTAGPPKTRQSKFFDEVEPISMVVFAPNQIVTLISPVTALQIGHVAIVQTAVLNDEAQKHHFKIKIGNHDGLQFADNFPLLEYPDTGWKVSVVGSRTTAREEAQWKINIAISLLRLALMDFGQRRGNFPYRGDLEAHPIIGTKLINDVKQVVLDRGSASLGGSMLAGWYEVDSATIDHLNQKNLNDIANAIFDPTADSIAGRLNNGLGWLTLARQTRPRAERFMHFFTALEALLTKDDPHAPVTQTTARFLSCILSNKNEDRETLANTIINLYNKRSKLIHQGNRSAIHASDVQDLQHFAEVAYWKIITKVAFTTSTTVFFADLKRASYGLEWPPAPAN